MSIKSIIAAGVLSTLSCFAQVVTTGGFATTAGPANTSGAPSAANAPLLATPDAALPGSGPAFGTPLSNANTNDPRSTNGPSVYNPNGMSFEENTTVGAATQNQVGVPGINTAVANNQPFEFGIQQIGFSAGPSSGTTSLGEIARELKAHRRAATKVLNNDSVARLNTASTGMGSLQPQSAATVASSASPSPAVSAPSTTLMAQNQPPALPQSDNADAATQPPAAASYSTAAQQRHAAAPQTAQDQSSASENAQPAAKTDTTANSAKGDHLPQTATHLPLLLLLGGLGAAGGALYYVRK